MDNRIRPLLSRYADFEFTIDTDAWEVSFNAQRSGRRCDDGMRDEARGRHQDLSRRGEYLHLVFLPRVAQLALDGAEAYRWVKYIYVDDPISSLDENNAVMVASTWLN